MYPDTISPEERIARWRRRISEVIHAARTQSDFLTLGGEPLCARYEDLAALGWRALHAGQREQAHRYFRAALHYDPYAVSAWLGLSRVAVSLDERRLCLQAALDLHLFVQHLERVRYDRGPA